MTILIAALLASSGAASPADFDRDLTTVLRKLGGGELNALAKASVRKHVDRFVAKGKLQKTWERKKEVWPTIARALAAEGLPEELGYVAWAESGFQADVGTSMGSRGVWQFIPATARRYGLRVEGTVDERMDLEKESRAAAAYLKKLLGEFQGAPLLALAAYNQGEKTVRAVSAAAPAEHAKDFFWLAQQGALDDEGAQYVPRILAAAIIGMNPERYGLSR